MIDERRDDWWMAASRARPGRTAWALASLLLGLAGALALLGVLWDTNTPVTLARAATSTVAVSGQWVGDPAFAADGYHLTAGSAAVNRGLDWGVGDDVDGDRRPSCARSDLGADEYVFAYVYCFPWVVR